jgi:hypothetical protein
MIGITPLETAQALDAYMRFRAADEGVEYDLSPDFFANAIEKGCELFFGVEIQDGKLVADEQQPKLFKKWKRDTNSCAYCGVPFEGIVGGNVDKYHRAAPLCDTCYGDHARCRATESAYDPTSFWNKTVH